MNPPSIPALALTWGAIFAGGWLGWQLLRQNGRILLRLDVLEKRLNELEFGEGDEPEGLPLGSEAPVFELPDLAGERKSLAQLRGQSVLLIFFSADCGFCREMLPKLAKVAAGFQPAVEGGILPPGINLHSTESQASSKDSAPTEANSDGLEVRLTGRQGCPPPQLLILTTGDAEKTRKFFVEHRISYPVLVQNHGEISKAYQANGTPTGYLISADGKIDSELAIGAEALLKLASEPRSSRREEALTEKSEIRNPKSEIRNGSETRYLVCHESFWESLPRTQQARARRFKGWNPSAGFPFTTTGRTRRPDFERAARQARVASLFQPALRSVQHARAGVGKVPPRVRDESRFLSPSRACR